MFSELKQVLRSLARSPGYTSVVVATLALGIGTTAGFYSVFTQTLLPNRWMNEPDRLVSIQLFNKATGMPAQIFAPRYVAYEKAQAAENVAASRQDALNLLINDEPEGISVRRVTVDYFSVLGVAPALGRAFLPEEGEEGRDGVALIAGWLWKNRFASDPAILGRELKLNGRSYRVVGVLPEGYQAPEGVSAHPIYVPLVVPKDVGQMRGFMGYDAIARLKPGVTREQLQAELETMNPEKGTTFERMMKDWRPVVSAVDARRSDPWFRRYRMMHWIMLASVAFLYAIACVNAGSLILVRAVGRRREVGIRLALGAKRWQIVRPLLMEGLVLAILAIGLGLLLGRWLLPALVALAPGSDATWSKGAGGLDGEAIGFTVALGLMTGLVVSILPAWRVTQLHPNETVKDGGGTVGESRRLSGLRGSLVVLEAALAVTLLIGTGLMVRTFQKIQQMKPGYETARRYALQITISQQEQVPFDVRTQKMVQIMERLAAVPGVTGAALAQQIVPRTYYSGQKLKVVNQPGMENSGEIEAELNPVSSEYLELLGIPMRSGRSLTGLHKGDAPVAVINEAMARRYFPDRSPIGERLEINGREKFEIVGVVGDVRSARVEPKPRCYYPYWQMNSFLNGLVVRTAGEAGTKFNAELRRAVYEVDPRFGVMNITSLEEGLKRDVAAERYTMILLEVHSALALVLAVVGLFATLAYSVVQRRGEFGIRFALGASVASIYRLVVGRGLALVATGVVLGLGMAWSLARFMESLLFETSAHDPLVFGLVGGVMLLVALPACWLPAMRATKVDLTKLMRSE